MNSQDMKDFLQLALFSILIVGCTGEEPNRWEATIQGFEALDEENAPPQDSILFVGSSSIVYWRSLAEDMAPLTVLNRGFGGSTMADLNLYRDRIVVKYKPRAIVVYEGDNDVARGKSPAEILPEYRDFIDHIRQHLGAVDIYLIAVKPSVSRWDMWDAMSEVNQGLIALSNQQENVHYFDIATPMMKESGEVRDDIFVEDNLHMNGTGYQIWKSVIRPVLLDRFGETGA